MVEGHVPAINIEHYLKSQRPKRTIRAKQYDDFITKNIIENSVCNNSKCFKPVITKTENYRNSFFVKTVYDWNKLSEDIVTCDSLETLRHLQLWTKKRLPPRRVKASIGVYDISTQKQKQKQKYITVITLTNKKSVWRK